MRLSQVRIELARFVSRLLGFRICIGRIGAAEKWKQHVNVGDSGPGERVVRIFGRGLLVIVERLLKIVYVAFVPEESPLQIQVVSGAVFRPAPAQRSRPAPAALARQGTAARTRTCVFKAKNAT